MKPLLPMLVFLIGPHDPKLNLEDEMSERGVALVGGIVSSDPAVAYPMGDGNEPNRKDPYGGTIQFSPPMPKLPNTPPDPKLNSGDEVSAP